MLDVVSTRDISSIIRSSLLSVDPRLRQPVRYDECLQGIDTYLGHMSVGLRQRFLIWFPM